MAMKIKSFATRYVRVALVVIKYDVFFDVLHSQCCACLYFLQIHGPWGDAIPQDEGVYCLWAILEFQDPPEFNYGEDNANSTSFNGIFEATVSSLNGVPEGGFLTNVATGGQVNSEDPEAIPWPASAIIWKSGNKYAKPWIKNSHRPTAQLPGYNFGFTGYIHVYWTIKYETKI